MEQIILEISNLTKERNNLYKIYNNSYNEELEDFTAPYPLEIDLLKDKIIILTKEHCEILPIDFILESFTHLGYAPNILYDDNGFWSCTSPYIATVPLDENTCDINLNFSIRKELWKDSIREAVKLFLSEF